MEMSPHFFFSFIFCTIAMLPTEFLEYPKGKFLLVSQAERPTVTPKIRFIYCHFIQ